MPEKMTKKTTSTKSTTKKNTVAKEIETNDVKEIETNDVEKVEINDVEEKETVNEKITKKAKSFEPSDLVVCTSVTAGELILIGKKTGNLYRWTDYGDTQEVEYQDLKSEKLNKMSKYIYSPLFMINDEDVLDSPDFKGVREVYDNMLSTEDIDAVFYLDLGNFRKVISEFPIGLKNTIKALAAEKIEDGSLDSINKIKSIDEILGTDFLNAYLGE